LSGFSEKNKKKAFVSEYFFVPLQPCESMDGAYNVGEAAVFFVYSSEIKKPS
jgi:hypothetical protein